MVGALVAAAHVVVVVVVACDVRQLVAGAGGCRVVELVQEGRAGVGGGGHGPLLGRTEG